MKHTVLLALLSVALSISAPFMALASNATQETLSPEPPSLPSTTPPSDTSHKKRPFPYGKKLRLRREGYGSLTGGEGIVLLGKKKEAHTSAQVSSSTVNTFLWTSAVDTLQFMPLSSSDIQGGLLVTDWYTDPQTPRKRFKVTVRVQGTDFQPHNLSVQVHTQDQDKNGTWGVTVNDTKLAHELENIMIDHAKVSYAQAHPEAQAQY